MAANGGLITKADLAAYESKERKALRGTFLGYDIISMPPPSSGGVALIEMLNMLELLEIQKIPRLSTEAIHLTTEVRRRGFLDRARFLGDPDFVEVPVGTLISKPHAREQIASINRSRASSSLELGKDIVTTQPYESEETTHFSVVDRNGMAVSNTYTLEGGYGSHVVVAGAGFLLNNEMGDFNKKPGTTNTTGDIGTPANVIAPGKRMLSSMTPVIVARAGKLVLGRILGRPHDHQHVARCRAGRDGVGPDGPRSRRCAADEPPMAARSPHNRRERHPRDHSSNAQHNGTRGAHERQAGGRADNLGPPHTGMVYGVIDKRSATAKASKR